MTRAVTFGALLLVAALVIPVASALLDSGSSGAGETYAQAQVVGTPTPTPERVGSIYRDWQNQLLLVLDSPTPDAPPLPTLTPTAPATNTPRPTVTPTATATRTPTTTRTSSQTPTHTQAAPSATPSQTSTVAPESTPTQESTLPPSNTPGVPTVPPTNTPPAPDKCTGVVTASALNVRAEPSTTATILGQVHAGDTLTLEAQKPVRGVVWYRIWWDVGVNGWVHSDWVDTVSDCQPPLEAAVLIGPHMLFNARADALAPLLSVAGVVKEVSGDGHLLRAANPQAVTIYRYVDDVLGSCSPDWMDGGQWVDALYARWPQGFDYYEVQNECSQFSRSYSNTHVIETMRRANELGVCLLLYSFGVGNPEIDFMPTITPALDYALANECQPGRHHALAMHAYGLGQPREDIWLFSRWRQLCAAISGYCEALGVWMTEWGWYGQESDPVSCALEVANVEWALAEYEDSPIRGVVLWSFGPLDPWRDVTNCAGVLANVIG